MRCKCDTRPRLTMALPAISRKVVGRRVCATSIPDESRGRIEIRTATVYSCGATLPKPASRSNHRKLAPISDSPTSTDSPPTRTASPSRGHSFKHGKATNCTCGSSNSPKPHNSGTAGRPRRGRLSNKLSLSVSELCCVRAHFIAGLLSDPEKDNQPALRSSPLAGGYIALTTFTVLAAPTCHLAVIDGASGVEVEHAVAVLRLTRAEKRNALNGAAMCPPSYATT